MPDWHIKPLKSIAICEDGSSGFKRGMNRLKASAKMVMVTWNMCNVGDNVVASHEKKILSNHMRQSRGHRDALSRDCISSAVVAALMALNRQTAFGQVLVNRIGESKLGQELPSSDLFLHARTNPWP